MHRQNIINAKNVIHNHLVQNFIRLKYEQINSKYKGGELTWTDNQKQLEKM